MTKTPEHNASIAYAPPIPSACITLLPPLPEGDGLTHAGDCLTHAGDCLGSVSVKSLQSFAEWLEAQPHRHKILVAGNHDNAIEKHPEPIPKLLPTTHYLQDSWIEIDGMKFWGSPRTPRFHGGAFMLDRASYLRSQWALIPDDTDVLITNGPAYLSGDRAIDVILTINVGREDLYHRARVLPLQVHLSGHIHEGYGMYQRNEQLLINSCSGIEHYEPTNKLVIFTVPARSTRAERPHAALRPN